MRSRIQLVFVSLLALAGLLSCGQDVCIAGIGNCAAYKKAASDPGKNLQTGGGSAPTGKLSLGCNSWGQCWTYSEAHLGLVVANAVGAYTLQLHDGMAGEIVNNNAFYLKTTGKVKSRVRVLDSTVTTMTQACDLCDVEITILPKP